jgi:hypothetical protein
MLVKPVSIVLIATAFRLFATTHAGAGAETTASRSRDG